MTVVAGLAVFFDFDGVLVASLAVKEAAFHSLFSELGLSPEDVQEAVAYHRSHGGLSRFHKFEWVYRTFFGRSLTPAESADLGTRFSTLVERAVVACPLMPGARETLERLHARGIPMVVVSGTPQDELRRIVHDRGMTHYFAEVLGSPTLKPQHLREQLAAFGWAAGDCLFVGDALTDHAAATETGMPFLGIVPEGSASPFPLDTHVVARVDIQVPA
jgi:phosphoglycolate phosphatase-like HAD superfamily hydrolase